ncbi:hypothetical protein [uncultured Dietzia sp.]|uniref:hypothetical protein n=1 Tax=uncultured Dietzia sp. TaxID=395519 RepID=UPI0025E11401|nr:hypothetical protein [uncultured Dietzia sp.]
MRGTRTTSAIAATFVTVAITTTATAASTTDDPTKDQGGVLVATFGDAEAPTPPRSMSLDELEATYPEVPADEINEYLSGDPSALRSQASVSQDESGLPIIGPASDAEAMAIEPGAYNTYKFFSDASGRGIRLRHGYYNATTGKGFGARKMYRKHNLTSDLAQRFMKGGYKASLNGTVRTYRRPAILWHCVPLSPCGIVDDTFIRIPVETAKLSDGMSRGIITGYCEDWDHRPRCKDWVKKTF